MKYLKKYLFFVPFLFPLSASALTYFAVGAGATLVGLVGASVYRSLSPVNIKDAYDFFSSCWTCQIFSDVVLVMSDLIPNIYSSIGRIVIPMSVALLIIFITWRILSGYINGKTEDISKLIGNFGGYLIKITVLVTFLLLPLPRLITFMFIEPAFSIGTSLDYKVSQNNNFAECMIATAIADPVAISSDAAGKGAFSPNMRHQLACEIANIHQVTGLGITAGWTILNMAFNREYMYKILNAVPIFPNVGLACAGLLLFVLYFYALLPIPLYFLEVFIKLSMDLIMLPLMLMAWLFDNDKWAILPQGGQTIRQMIDDVIKAVVGISLTTIFLSFSISVLNSNFTGSTFNDVLREAIENNDSKMLMDGVVLGNDSFIKMILMGIFIAMFMTLIPQLTSMLFKIKISDKYYQTAKSDVNTIWKNIKKYADTLKK